MRRFFLNTTQIDEPIGYESIVFNVVRDNLWHGVFFEASSSTLTFLGDAAAILRDARDTDGVDAVVIFKSEIKCDGESEYQTEIEGRLNFANYEQTCGDECRVSISVEQDSCAMVFKNRFEQKIDLSVNKAFDKITNLVDYPGLDRTITLPTQEIPISADASVPTDDVSNLGSFGIVTLFDTVVKHVLFRPLYETVNDNSILTGQLNDPFNVFQDIDNFFPLSPQLLLEEPGGCINEEFIYNVRLKGTLRVNGTWSDSADVNIDIITRFVYWDAEGDIVYDSVIIDETTQHTNINLAQTYSYDVTYSGSQFIPTGAGVYAFTLVRFEVNGGGALNVDDVISTFQTGTSFLLSNTKACPPTDAQVNLVNETLARLTEAITDRCLTIKSDYYGRTDSKPYSHDADGCGSLRVLTNGLKIRQAEDKKFFLSMRDVMDGLRAIDNIGMGMYAGDIRIEPAEWFYNDEKILDLPLVPTVKTSFEESLIYTSIKGGYEKWEIKSIKGIDEFNSQKEYRTSIKSVSNSLDIRSKLIAAGYIIENLRTQTLLSSGNTDSTYDNDPFIICVKRDGSGYEVEQGIIENAENIFSPATVYNWRIRPIYNLMRWFKSIVQSYTNLNNTESKIFFSSGTGNYEAKGNISVYDDCSLESRVIAENSDISISDFKVTPTPIYRPESSNLKYPLTIAQYEAIKLNPYGYINVQCGTGEYKKYYIKTIKYKPVEGMADFELIQKW